jgi:hypothetical protein
MLAAVSALMTMVVPWALTSPPAAQASAPPATWTGRSAGLEESDAFWSLGPNWEGGVAPNVSEGIGTLTFPHLSNPTCYTASPADTCYLTFNNYPLGLSVESLKVDDADEYLIAGEPFTLGSGGLSASPASGSSGEAWDVVETPVQLGASQKWDIAGRGGLVAENGLIFFNGSFGSGSVSGAGHALGVELSGGPLFFLDKTDTEVGPVTVDGADTSKIASNGLVSMLHAKLNSSDGEPVAVSHVFFAGSGALGPLRTSDTILDVGAPGEDLEAASAKLDPGTSVEFTITGEGRTPATDYAQLTSHGAVELGGAKIEVVIRPPKQGAPCPTVNAGETFTFVSTSGTLAGSFSNAPEHGAEIPIRYAEACAKKSQKIEISYRESGGTQTVTGIVEEAAAKKQQEEEVAARKRREEEEATTRRRQEEEAAARKRQEEEAASGKRQEVPTVVPSETGGGLPAGAAGTAAREVSGKPAAPGIALLARTVKVEGKTAMVLVRCNGTVECEGSLKLLARIHERHAVTRHGKRQVLTGMRTVEVGVAAGFFIAPGRVERLRAHLTSEDEKLIHRAGHAGLTVTVKGNGVASSSLVLEEERHR